MEKDKNTKEMGDTATVYEVSYLLLPSLGESQVWSAVGSIKDTITSLHGEVISSEDPILIDLAYPMSKVIQTVGHKFQTGHFGWIKFEIEKDGLVAVQKMLDAEANILRYLIVKTVRENTLLNGKMIFKKEELEKEVSEDESVVPGEAAPEDEKEIDKSIDGLVIA